jgi:L-threonylcarbamoyladenylate synthase
MPHAKILPTHTPALFDAAVEQAAAALRRGEVVALPTETVYGLAANALDENTVRKIFEAKGRPAHNPIIVHVSDLAMARRCSAQWPVLAEKLAAAFWPGPLTVVVGGASEIPRIVTAGGETVGVRWPSHPIMQAVIRACGFPLAAPSANLSNSISPTTAEHVRRQLGDQLALIVDGGPAQVGIESTVIDLTTQPPRVLRPGMIHEESLLAVLGEREMRPRPSATIPAPSSELRSPGLLKKHYAPKAKLLLLRWRDATELHSQVSALNLRRETTHVLAHTQIPATTDWAGVSVMPHEAAAFARALYAELHHCDEAGAATIVVESLPAGTEWQAITDRLTRAAAD